MCTLPTIWVFFFYSLKLILFLPKKKKKKKKFRNCIASPHNYAKKSFAIVLLHRAITLSQYEAECKQQKIRALQRLLRK
jgi:hypothetical protein